ncbi:MAG: beta-sandwich lipoprotein, partial [Candidatus Kariarchaeaceae archaeon]
MKGGDTMKKFLLLAFAAFCFFSFNGNSSCSTDADVASHNLSKAADQFQIMR